MAQIGRPKQVFEIPVPRRHFDEELAFLQIEAAAPASPGDGEAGVGARPAARPTDLDPAATAKSAPPAGI